MKSYRFAGMPAPSHIRPVERHLQAFAILKRSVGFTLRRAQFERAGFRLVQVEAAHIGADLQHSAREIAPACAEIRNLAFQILRQMFDQQPRTLIDLVEGEHARSGDELVDIGTRFYGIDPRRQFRQQAS